MRRAPVIALLAAAAAPAPATADTVAHRTPAVGPKIAGAQTVWGEEHDQGVQVMLGSRGAAPREIYRLPDSNARKTHRSFFRTPWALSASPTHVAAIVFTNTITSEGSDFVGTAVAPAAVGGPFGTLATIAGRTPRRGDTPCRDELEVPEAVAVDGTRIATAEFRGRCEGGDRELEYRISIRDGDAVQVLPVERQATAVRLAGNLVAWLEQGGDALVVYDLAAAAEALRVERFAIDDLDLDADGTVAVTFANGPRARRFGLARVGTPGLRTLDRRVADRGVALAGGRVLYEKLDRGDFRTRLLLRELDGGVRRLATFTPRRRRTGDLDLSADRAVWAAQKTRSADYEAKPSGPARIVSRPL